MNVLEQRQAEAVVSIAKTLRSPDWEQRRYEIAKDIFAHTMLLPHDCLSCLSLTSDDENAAVYAEIAVDLADALIKELRKRSKREKTFM